MFLLSLISGLVLLVMFMEYISRIQYWNNKIKRRLGMGFLVYSSLSRKTSWFSTRKEALEWMGCCTEGDTVMMCNRSKDTLAIRFKPIYCGNFA